MGTHTTLDQFITTGHWTGASEEVVVAAHAQIAHRGVDPAATTRDLKIRHPRGA